MDKNIVLVILTIVVAISAILINPKQDDDKRFFKPTPMGYLLILILLIVGIFQVCQILDDNETQSKEKLMLIEKNKSDSLYQQKEIVDRNNIIAKSEKLLHSNDTTILLQKYIVDLQRELLQKSENENKIIQGQLNSILGENKRLNYKIKPVMDISVFIPIEDYSFGINTKFRIPSIKSYYLINKDTIFNIGPNMEYFTDSLCLSILKELFGPNLLLKLNVFKPDNPNSMWINAAYKVQLVEKDTTNGFKIAAHWYANLVEELKDKSDRKNYRTNIGMSGEHDIWKLRINLYNIPIGIEVIYPDLSLMDFTEIGTKYEIQLNSKNLDIDFCLTIKGDYNNYLSKIRWNSYPIEKNDGSVYGSSLYEQIKSKSIAVYDTNSYWLPIGIP